MKTIRTNKMTKASTETYWNPENQVRRLTHKQRCLQGLEREPGGLNFDELATKIGLTSQQTWKRLSELNTENSVYICNEVFINEQRRSKFKLVQQLQLYPKAKILTFRQYAEKCNPEWIFEYELFNQHKL